MECIPGSLLHPLPHTRHDLCRMYPFLPFLVSHMTFSMFISEPPSGLPCQEHLHSALQNHLLRRRA